MSFGRSKTWGCAVLEVVDHDAVRELRMAHPPVNALREELLCTLREAVMQAPEEGARALVVSGLPGCFSAGLDVPHLLGLSSAGVEASFAELLSLMRALGTSRIPVAAAVTGHSPAGGAVIALFCDYRVMATGDYRIGLNEVQVGLPMPPVIHAALARLVGPRVAERMCVEATLVDAAEAARLGMVDETAEPEHVVARAIEWCRKLTSLPNRAMSATRATARHDLVELLDATDALIPSGLTQAWNNEETQTTLRALVARLSAKR